MHDLPLVNGQQQEGTLNPVLSWVSLRSILSDRFARFQYAVKQRSQTYQRDYYDVKYFVDKVFEIDQEAMVYMFGLGCDVVNCQMLHRGKRWHHFNKI